MPVEFNLSEGKDVMTFNLTDPKYSNSNQLYGQDYESIKRNATQTGTLFKDELFPPSKYSLSYTGQFDGVDIDYLDIKWTRATDLFKNARFIKNGSSKNDVNQGQLGDCWFLCSLAVMAEREDLFKKVVPEGQGIGKNYCGAFHFRFWRWGDWIDVVVDDFIPVFDGRPLFTYSDDKGEIWPLLLEKAFAKLHGSYFHLCGGFSVASLENLTGGVTERFVGYWGPLYPLEDENKKINSLLFDKIATTLQNEGLVTASTFVMDKMKMGIFGGHAYSVTGICSLPEVDLIKIRNPWGIQFEWVGSWSDDSDEMKRIDKKLRDQLKTEEGEWWMDFNDFLQCYTLVEFCHILKNQWDTEDFVFLNGTWTSGSSNQFYLMKIDKKDDVFISLEQKFARQLRDELRTEATDAPISLEIFDLGKKFLKNKSKKRALDLGSMKNAKQVHFGNNADFKELSSVTFYGSLKKGAYLVKVSAYTETRDVDFFLRFGSRNGTHQVSAKYE